MLANPRLELLENEFGLGQFQAAVRTAGSIQITHDRDAISSGHLQCFPIDADRPKPRGFRSLVTIMDWTRRAGLSWRRSKTMTAAFCGPAPEEAVTSLS
ncbi:MAG: hypothetical protein ACREC9_00100 [Methylocella sp.]